jgi:hypothetical protein
MPTRPVCKLLGTKAQSSHIAVSNGAQSQVDALPCAPSQNARRGTSAARKHDRRRRLIEAGLRRHGASGFALFVDRLELDFGDLGLDRRLEDLVDADPRAIDLAGAMR